MLLQRMGGAKKLAFELNSSQVYVNKYDFALQREKEKIYGCQPKKTVVWQFVL